MELVSRWMGMPWQIYCPRRAPMADMADMADMAEVGHHINNNEN